MAGYLGSKAVLLSTTAAVVTGNADIGGDLTVDTNTLYVDSTNNNVGIGTSLPDRPLHVTRGDGTGTVVKVGNTGTSSATIEFSDTGTTDTVSIGSVGNDLTLKSDDGDISLNTTGDPATASLYVERGGNVGIGTSSPRSDASTTNLHVSDSQVARVLIESTATNGKEWGLYSSAAGELGFYDYDTSTEAMRIDSSGNLLVGKTSQGLSNIGFEATSNGTVQVTRDGSFPLAVNRLTSDGDIISLRKDGSTVGSIGVSGNRFYFTATNGVGVQSNFFPVNADGSVRDNGMDLGVASARWQDIFATNATIQTSDINEKQQISSLTVEELTAAKTISGLFKTFKWNDSVAEKGDDARTHTGVIAQEVEQALTDAGLDAGDYAFFISSTWWETQTEVPAVEAVEEVLDEEGNVVVEAVEAQEAYTRTDTYDTLEEAPEGATERNRKGIRYPELLSFIGAATEQRLASIEARLDALEGV